MSQRRTAAIRVVDKVDTMRPLLTAKAIPKTPEASLNRRKGPEPRLFVSKLPDLGQINVRATDHAGGRLIIRPKDPAGVYVLVIVQANKCNVAGWIGAAEARRDLFKSQPDPHAPPCWAVPQEQLHPIGTIRQKIQSVNLAPAFTGAN